MGKNNIEQLNIAKKYLGYGGSRFRKFCGLPAGAAWCDAYVTTIFHEAGNSSLFCSGKKQTYCPTTMKWCEKNLASVPPYLALPSDIIFFDWEPNGIPNHIGFVRERKDCDSIYTIEGNTNGSICAKKTRNTKYVCGIFRPHFKASYKLGTLEVDGMMGYNTIAMLQKALKIEVDGILGQGTVKALQRLCGTSADGLWGKATSKAVQKMVGATADGLFGPDSVKALQKWINKVTASSPSDPLKPWFDAMRDQYKWSKNQKYEWTTPTVESSRKRGTCITFIAVSLQRIGLIPKGSYFYCDPKKRKITGKAAKLVEKSKKFKLWYPKKTVYELWKAGEIKPGDIVSYADPDYHTMEFDGMENGEPRFNTMGGGKRGLHVAYPYYAKRKVDMLVRIVKVR
jgi:hypothetical protein